MTGDHPVMLNVAKETEARAHFSLRSSSRLSRGLAFPTAQPGLASHCPSPLSISSPGSFGFSVAASSPFSGFLRS